MTPTNRESFEYLGVVRTVMLPPGYRRVQAPDKALPTDLCLDLMAFEQYVIKWVPAGIEDAADLLNTEDYAVLIRKENVS